jgi:hypothetical protein
MPLGVFVPPRSVVEASLPAWLEMANYTTQLDSITSTFSTGEFIMEYFPPDSITILGIGWRLVTAFTAASDDVFPVIYFGDTAEHNRFFSLNIVQLGDTEFGGQPGFAPLYFQDTSSDGMSLTAFIDWAGGEAPTAGDLELWLTYRVRSGRSANRGSNVV